MTIIEILNDKALKPKDKTETLSQLLLDKKLNLGDLIKFADTAKDPVKATCIESLEYTTKQHPSLLNRKAFEFVTANLASKAPRVKWESARVIGNTAHLFKDKLDSAIDNLLKNSSHEGTVVRWSVAFALGEIIKLKTKHNKALLDNIELVINQEEKDSIKKIYLDAIKKVAK
jgi:HEAT repeat protein